MAVEKKIVPKTTTAKTRPPSKKAIEDAVENALKEANEAIGKTKFTCSLCGKLVDVEKKGKAGMYRSTDPHNKIGYVTICRECIEEIVYQIDPNDPAQTRHNPTKESIQTALEYMDKPWYEKLYEASLQEAANTITGKTKNDVWTSYIKNIQMKNYVNKRWKDGEGPQIVAGNCMPDFTASGPDDLEEMCKANKKKVLHDLGYDPFESADEKMKPIMYNKLAGFLDESTSEDQLKLDACIAIVQFTSQAEKTDYVINYLQRTPDSLIKNSATIKALISQKKDIYSTALNLAADNGISINHSKKNTKGGDTWSGQVKKLRESKLRFGEVDAFDIGTAEGMKQVARISQEAILEKLSLSDDDYGDMLATANKKLTEALNKCDAAVEEARLLKRENKDLKEFLRQKGLINERDEVIG